MEAFPKLPNMKFGTTDEEMAKERKAMALELLETSGMFFFFLIIINCQFCFSLVFDAENKCSMCAKDESPGSALTDWVRCCFLMFYFVLVTGLKCLHFVALIENRHLRHTKDIAIFLALGL